MHIADDARLVLRWTCKECKHVNYYTESTSEKTLAEVAKVAQEMDMDPSELSMIPEVLCCLKCEAAHKLPDSVGETEIGGGL